jgi:hypothetical protein
MSVTTEKPGGTTTIRPFTVEISDAEVEDLRSHDTLIHTPLTIPHRGLAAIPPDRPLRCVVARRVVAP